MFVLHVISGSRVTPEIDNAKVHCHRACVTAESSNCLTVVSITGEIDALNAEPVSEHIRGFVVPGRALVLDLSEVEFLGVAAVRSLMSLGEACAEAQVAWAVIASHAVRRLLDIADRDGRIPAGGSMVEVLDRLGYAQTQRPVLRLVT